MPIDDIYDLLEEVAVSVVEDNGIHYKKDNEGGYNVTLFIYNKNIQKQYKISEEMFDGKVRKFTYANSLNNTVNIYYQYVNHDGPHKDFLSIVDGVPEDYNKSLYEEENK